MILIINYLYHVIICINLFKFHIYLIYLVYNFCYLSLIVFIHILPDNVVTIALKIWLNLHYITKLYLYIALICHCIHNLYCFIEEYANTIEPIESYSVD